MIPFNHLGIVFNTFGFLIYSKSVRQTLCEFLEKVTLKARVLDIGAGTGMLCEFGYVCRDDLVYVAVDPAGGMLKYAKSYVETHVAAAEALPFEDESFDVVMMGESLHHFRDVNKALSECVRVLKNGGKLFIYDFNVNSFMGKNICSMEKLLGEPGHFFAPEDLQKKLESHGFTVKIRTDNWRYTVSAILT